MVRYINNFIKNPENVFSVLQNELNWIRREQTPRSEYYINDIPVPYTYGKGRGVREYLPQPTHPVIEEIKSNLKELTGFTFEVCFLNRYHNQSDHLGWHADDSPEMDDNRPIAVISFGVEREIWYCPQSNTNEVEKQKLASGSLFLMPPGMQDTHFHRIPKASFMCGERISLTFRGYVDVKNKEKK